MNRQPANFRYGAGLLPALYSFALTGVLLLAVPWWLRGLCRGGKYREGLRERLGRIPARLKAPTAGQTVVWVHAVSVGEVLASVPLVHALQTSAPNACIYVSTTTRTGQAVARDRFGGDRVFYFPADFAFAVRPWLRFLRPGALVLVESELWPRVLYEADRADVPVAVVNGRISSRSWPRYRRLRALWRPLLRSLAFVQAQSAEDAERFRYLAAQNVTTGGNLKYDQSPPGATPLLLLLKAFLPPDAPILVCGSTLADEEKLLLQNLPPEPIILLAPRHPERFSAVASLLESQSRPWQRLSAWRTAPQPIAAGTVLLLDSVGDLAALYDIATVSIVGGGFLHAGGHNPLEPAALGKPVLIGPGYANFLDIVQKLREIDAIFVADLQDVSEKITRLLTFPEKAAAMGERARQVCAQQSGATARALAAILGLIEKAQP